jgi:hypothetical protein
MKTRHNDKFSLKSDSFLMNIGAAIALFLLFGSNLFGFEKVSELPPDSMHETDSMHCVASPDSLQIIDVSTSIEAFLQDSSAFIPNSIPVVRDDLLKFDLVGSRNAKDSVVSFCLKGVCRGMSWEVCSNTNAITGQMKAHLKNCTQRLYLDDIVFMRDGEKRTIKTAIKFEFIEE